MITMNSTITKFIRRGSQVCSVEVIFLRVLLLIFLEFTEETCNPLILCTRLTELDINSIYTNVKTETGSNLNTSMQVATGTERD